MKRILLSMALLSIMLFIVSGCNLFDDGRIYGDVSTKSLVPCSHGPKGCIKGDSLKIEDINYLLVKNISDSNEYRINETHSDIPKNTMCSNSVCVTYCKDGECYKEDKKGTFVDGVIFKNESSKSYDLKASHILLK